MDRYLKLGVSYTEEAYEDVTIHGPTYEEVSVDSIVNELPDHKLHQIGLLRVRKDKNGKISSDTATLLKDHGWVHVDTIKDRAEKKEFETKYYLLSPNYHDTFYDRKFRAIDLDNLSTAEIENLASGWSIVQVVAPKSVLSEKDYNRLTKAREKKRIAAEAAQKAKATKEEKKRLREIEKAKKLLEEAGELK